MLLLNKLWEAPPSKPLPRRRLWDLSSSLDLMETATSLAPLDPASPAPPLPLRAREMERTLLRPPTMRLESRTSILEAREMPSMELLVLLSMRLEPRISTLELEAR